MTLCNNKQNIKYWQTNEFTPIYDDSLVLWLTSDFDSSTQWIDRSQYGVTTTPTNTTRTLIHPSGIFGSTFSFNGVNQSIECGNLSQYTITTNGVTIEAWIKGNAQLKNCGIISKRVGTSTPNYELQAALTGQLRIIYCHGIYNADNVTTSTTYFDNKWYHVVGTIDFTTGIKSIYINGVLESSNSSNQIGDPICTSANPLTVGRDGPDYFNGNIDSIRIYNRPLTPTEVVYNYTHSHLYYINYAII